MNTNTQKPNNNEKNEAYVRTPEDDEKDKSELHWKQQRAREAIEEFLRHHPDGRAVPRAE